MNSINLVIGGGMAAGPALAGALLQRFSSADAPACGGRRLRADLSRINSGGIVRRKE